MNDGPFRRKVPGEPAWDRLRSTSEALAAPATELCKLLGIGLNPVPVAPLLPPAELLARARRMWLRQRMRERLFGCQLFRNPAWNILLDLFIAGEEGRDVTVKCACGAAGVSQSTALRHIAHLTEVRLVTRLEHPGDARSFRLELTERGRSAMLEFLSLRASGPDERGA